MENLRVLALLLLWIRLTVSAPVCDNGFYWSHASGDCTPCTQCASNELQMRMCYGELDTMCVAWPKFNFLNEPSRESDEKQRFESSKNTYQPTASTEILSSGSSDDGKWFTVTMVLVGILVFTCVVGVVIVLIACVVCKRKDTREIIYDAGYISSSKLLQDSHEVAPFKVIPSRNT